MRCTTCARWGSSSATTSGTSPPPPSAIVNWHQLEPMCPQCGGPTTVINGGFARHCAVVRTRPLPADRPGRHRRGRGRQDRLLLGGQQAWGNRVSVLAGFVEAGESLEQAIHREIGEEVDISLSELAYFGSQPWPFPRSLMVGFFARASSTDICVDADEIAYADWHTRDGLAAKLDAGELGLPGRSSIAYRLIQTWLDGDTPLS